MHGATPAALVAAVLLALGSSCAATPTPAAPYEASERPDHRLSLLFGGRFLDEDGLDDLGVGGLQEQPGFGLELSTCPPTWPIGFELGVAGAVDEDEDDVTGVDVEGRLAEIYAGLRKNFETGTAVVPYVVRQSAGGRRAAAREHRGAHPGVLPAGQLRFRLARRKGFSPPVPSGADLAATRRV